MLPKLMTIRVQSIALILSLTWLAQSNAHAIEIGFYNPTGVHPDFASKVDFAMVEVITEKQVMEALVYAEQAGMHLTLNIGTVITESLPVDEVNRQYLLDGEVRTKRFPPNPKHKIKRFVDDGRLDEIIDRLALALTAHPGVIDTIFLIDEPYLKGVKPDTIDRIARHVKKGLKARDVEPPKLGVVFASMMYHPDFAQMLSEEAARYAGDADARYDSEQTGWIGAIADVLDWESRWVKGFRAHRLVTYDQAGNLYTEGGLPGEVDVIGFNFYTSTLLLDDMYRNVPQWLADRFTTKACAPFNQVNVAQIRDSLSFFDPISANLEMLETDEDVLDHLFSCRLQSVGQALKEQMRQMDQPYEVVMIGESSSNGVMDFDANRGLKTSQDPIIIEQRVLSEVERYLDPKVSTWIPQLKRIAFFTYTHTRDHSIQQTIYGAEDFQAVTARIFEASDS